MWLVRLNRRFYLWPGTRPLASRYSNCYVRITVSGSSSDYTLASHTYLLDCMKIPLWSDHYPVLHVDAREELPNCHRRVAGGPPESG